MRPYSIEVIFAYLHTSTILHLSLGDGVPPPSRVKVHDCSDQLSPYSWPLPWLSKGVCRFGRLPAISKQIEESPVTVANKDGGQVLPPVLAIENCAGAHVHTGAPAIVGMEQPVHTALPAIADMEMPIDAKVSGREAGAGEGFLRHAGAQASRTQCNKCGSQTCLLYTSPSPRD